MRPDLVPLVFRQAGGGHIAFLQFALLGDGFATVQAQRVRIGSALPTGLKGLPRGQAARLKGLHEVPQRCVHDFMRERGIPGDVHAEGLVLVEAQIPGELAPHEREGASDAGARLLNFLHRMRGFELHPIDARDLGIGL